MPKVNLRWRTPADGRHRPHILIVERTERHCSGLPEWSTALLAAFLIRTLYKVIRSLYK